MTKYYLENMERNLFWCWNLEHVKELAEELVPLFTKSYERSVARSIVYYFVKKAKEKKMEQCIKYIRNNPVQLEIALFDLIMQEYVWYMGEANYRVGYSTVFFRAAWKSFTKDGTFKTFGIHFREESAYLYVRIVEKLRSMSYLVLANLLKADDPVINIEQYERLKNKYITLKTHVDYENIVVPIGHWFKEKNMLNIISANDRDTIIDYYKQKYTNEYLSLSNGFKGDYPDYFYRKPSLVPFQDRSIYGYE